MNKACTDLDRHCLHCLYRSLQRSLPRDRSLILAPSQLCRSSVGLHGMETSPTREPTLIRSSRRRTRALWTDWHMSQTLTNVTQLQILHRFHQIPPHGKALLPKVFPLQSRCFSSLEVCHYTSSENFLQLVGCCFRLSWRVQGKINV